ncbi:MAG: sulfurtransferase, partial [Terriglobales bacterium]
RMGYGQFARLDLIGASLYTLAYTGIGFLFSDLIVAIAKGAATVGRVVEWLLLVVLIGYVAYRAYLYWQHREYRIVPRVQVTELAERLADSEGTNVVVADVRSHGYYDPGATRIKGSIRLEPNNLLATVKEWPHDKQIYLYCT